MGVTSWAKKKIREKVEGYKEERQFKHDVEAKAKTEFRKGYEEGRVTSARARGKAVGSGRTVQGITGRGVVGKVSGFAEGAGKGLQRYDDVFGVSGGGGFGGVGSMGFFGDEGRRKQPSQRVTKVSKSGTVTISEPTQASQQEQDPWGMGGGNLGLGATNKKKDKHPLAF
jgi:hypothetical protein